jgi:hypothetical protein
MKNKASADCGATGMQNKIDKLLSSAERVIPDSLLPDQAPGDFLDK